MPLIFCAALAPKQTGSSAAASSVAALNLHAANKEVEVGPECCYRHRKSFHMTNVGDLSTTSVPFLKRMRH